MLSRFDDFPIHQTPEPVAVRATSDRNAYDRYWFNGYDREGAFYFGVAMGLYPNRGVMDCAFSIVKDGEQHSFFASRRAPDDPSETVVGPFRIEVVEPMRVLRLTIDKNDTGIECDLTFTARTASVEEGRQTMKAGTRTVMDATRFAQFGRWGGRITYAGHEVEVAPDKVWGTKDRSWGIRPVGEPDQGGAPMTRLPQVFFLWAPIQFADKCTYFGLFDGEDGRPWYSHGAISPAYDSVEAIPGVMDPEAREMAQIEHEITYESGTRRAESARLSLIENDGTRHVIDVEPLLCFQMKGIGYTHPVWGHGRWRGELAIGGESWRADELDGAALENQHIQQLVRARMGDEEGIGTLEQFSLGPHARYGFTGFMEGAP